MSTQNEREEFENKLPPSLSRERFEDHEGDYLYRDPFVQGLWIGWASYRTPLLSRIAELEKELRRVDSLLAIEEDKEKRLQSRIDALSKDAERLDSGCIMTHERDDYGQEYKCQRNGLNLRAAIDAAISAREGE